MIDPSVGFLLSGRVSLFGAVRGGELACGVGLQYERAPPPPKKNFGGLSDSVVVDQSVDYSLFEFLTETC